MERRMFDWDSVYKGGEEWSFEEVRARQRGLMGKEWRNEVKEWEILWHVPGCECALHDRQSDLTTASFHTKESKDKGYAISHGQYEARERGGSSDVRSDYTRRQGARL